MLNQKYEVINDDKEDLSLEIYGERYYRLTSHERRLIDLMYISKYNLKENEK